MNPYIYYSLITMAVIASLMAFTLLTSFFIKDDGQIVIKKNSALMWFRILTNIPFTTFSALNEDGGPWEYRNEKYFKRVWLRAKYNARRSSSLCGFFWTSLTAIVLLGPLSIVFYIGAGVIAVIVACIIFPSMGIWNGGKGTYKLSKTYVVKPISNYIDRKLEEADRKEYQQFMKDLNLVNTVATSKVPKSLKGKKVTKKQPVTIPKINLKFLWTDNMVTMIKNYEPKSEDVQQAIQKITIFSHSLNPKKRNTIAKKDKLVMAKVIPNIENGYNLESKVLRFMFHEIRKTINDSDIFSYYSLHKSAELNNSELLKKHLRVLERIMGNQEFIDFINLKLGKLYLERKKKEDRKDTWIARWNVITSVYNRHLCPRIQYQARDD